MPTMKLCTVQCCDNQHVAKGYCSKHLQRMRRNGCIRPVIFALGEQSTNEEITLALFSKRLVDPITGCWKWTGGKMPYAGYGRKKYGGRYVLVHRLAARVWLGHEVRDPRFVLHSCDNRLCFNPEHLRIGTNDDNMSDKAIRKRVLGSRHPRAKLREPDIVVIRRMLAQGQSQRRVACLYGVSRGCIRSIEEGKNWKHVT